MRQSADRLKWKLRQLKKLEHTIRFKGLPTPENAKLVWDVFFSTKSQADKPVKYPLPRLLQMEREELKTVFEEFFYRVYFQYSQDQDLTLADVYNPHLLALLGLPAYAGLEDVKRRFRELAKRYHPDMGGESEKFVELMETYKRLTDLGR
jgi:hypothetical protein